MTETAKLKAALLRTQIENFQLRNRLDSDALTKARGEIEAEILKDEAEGSTFNWETLEVVAPAPKTEPKSKTK